MSVDRLSAVQRDTFAALQQKVLSYYRVDAESRFLKLAEPAITAHVLEAGAGEPMLILHGGDGEAVDWSPLLRELQGQAHLFAVDRPGFGLTDRFDYRQVDLRLHAGEFVVAVLDALGLESATVVGGSMGGFFSLAAALDHPTRVRALVLVGYPAGLTRSAPLGLRAMAAIPPLGRLIMHSLGARTDKLKSQYRQMFHTDPAMLPELYFETRLAGLRLPGAQDTWALLLHRLGGIRGIRREAYLGDELSRLRQPTLLIWGEQDLAPTATGEAAAATIPNATFVSLEGVGHFPFLHAPDRTAALIMEFLHRHPRQP